MADGLPEIYAVDGVRTSTKAPNGAEIETLVPLEHIAYNIVLPRVGKRIDPKNYRRKIQTSVRGVSFYKNLETGGGVYSREKEEIRINIGCNSGTSSLAKVARSICAELGHAFSLHDYDISMVTIAEYYDRLAEKIGEKELEHTKYSFETSDVIKLINDCNEVIEGMKMILETAPDKLRDLLDNINDGKDLKYARRKLNEERRAFEFLKGAVDDINEIIDLKHTKGYMFADFMCRNFNPQECFTDPKAIFSCEDYKIVFKPEIAGKLDEKEKEFLDQLYKKIDVLYHHKYYMTKKQNGKTGEKIIFDGMYSLLDNISKKVSVLEENDQASQIFMENIKKYGLHAS